MTFRKAVEQTPHLQQAWKAGFGALRRRDRPHVTAEDPRRLAGSVNVDAALKSTEPHAHRWDFAIGYKHTNRREGEECVYWVEVHTASDKEVTVVLKKLAWLRGWLAGDGRSLSGFEREFVWVSSGETSFTDTSTQKKRFALQGLRHQERILKIPNVRPA